MVAGDGVRLYFIFSPMSGTIEQFFPNYLEDKIFGGSKDLVFVHYDGESGEFMCVYIDPGAQEGIPPQLEMRSFCNDFLEGIFLEQEIFPLNEILDVADPSFCAKLDEMKIPFFVEHFDRFKQYYHDYFHWIFNRETNVSLEKHRLIYRLFGTDSILNGEWYGKITGHINGRWRGNEVIMLDMVNLNSGCEEPEAPDVRLYKIENKYYDEDSFLEPFIPWCVLGNDDGTYELLNSHFIRIGGYLEGRVDFNSPNTWTTSKLNEPWKHTKGAGGPIDRFFVKKFFEELERRNLHTCLNPPESQVMGELRELFFPINHKYSTRLKEKRQGISSL